jgi:MoaA/NifB/PqqE/SkfB family radical SAM enzyme
MGLTIKWDITYKCSLRCNHCINGNLLGNIENELSLESVKSILDKLVDNQVEYVQFLGGEPLQRSDFISIMYYMESLKIKHGFNTNGLKLRDKNLLKYIISSKYLSRITCSLDGPTREINDDIRGKNVFDVVVDNLRHLTDLIKKYHLNIDIEINSVICRRNKNYITPLVELCVSLGAQSLSLLGFVVEGVASLDDLISFNDMIIISREVAQLYALHKNKISIIPKYTRPIMREFIKKKYSLDFPEVQHYCGAGMNFAYIDNRGLLFPCDRFASKIHGRYNDFSLNLLHNDYSDIWNRAIFSMPYEKINSDLYREMTPCKYCKYFMNSCYPCYISFNKGEATSCLRLFEYLECSTYE